MFPFANGKYEGVWGDPTGNSVRGRSLDIFCKYTFSTKIGVHLIAKYLQTPNLSLMRECRY